MRLSTVAAALCLSLSVAAASAPQSAAAAGTAAAAAPAAVPPSEAAARHAKRTACLKDARAKKLLGADRTSFLKTCIAAP